MSMFSSLKSFDVYPKLHEDMKVKTFSGAAVSMVAIFVIVLLFFSELSFFLSVVTKDHLYVDTDFGESMMINFDVTFHHIPCELLSVDAVDVVGQRQIDTEAHVIKTPLDKHGNKVGKTSKTELGEDKLTTEELKQAADQRKHVQNVNPSQETNCGSCYGAEMFEGHCCNTCDEVKQAYSAKGWNLYHIYECEQCTEERVKIVSDLKKLMAEEQGCQIAGYIDVKKCSGSFHFVPGRNFQHAHMYGHDIESVAGVFNVTHTINSLTFGESYPGIVNPLDGLFRAPPKDAQSAMFLYYAKVVPTVYMPLRGEEISSNQYSVTQHMRNLNVLPGEPHVELPGVFFFYEMSPIQVKFTEHRESFTHFLTQLCAILGGVFTVAGMVDRVLYSTIRKLEKKMEINKLS